MAVCVEVSISDMSCVCYLSCYNRYIVEMEVVLPADMSVQDSHDISLDLQHKVRAAG